MTQEARIVFDLHDISRIRVLCSECGGEVTVPMRKGSLRKDSGIPEHECPYCQTSWSQTGRLAEFGLINDLRVRANCERPRPIKLRFEIDRPAN